MHLHKVGCHAQFERPANDFPVEQIQHDGQIQPAFVSPKIRDVRRPGLIGCRRHKIPVPQICRHRQAVFRVHGDLIAPLVPHTNAIFAHQPFDWFLACCKAAQPQFPDPSRTAISCLKFDMNGADHRQGLLIRKALAIWRATLFPGARNGIR